MPLGICVVAVIAWSLAVTRYRRRFGHPYPRLRTLASGAGIMAIAIALGGPLDALADASFAWHMAQHLIFLLIAPPLILLGRPLDLLLAIVPVHAARAIVAVLGRAPFAWLGMPFVGFFSFIAVAWVAHFSGLYEAAAEHESVHVAEHLLFLGAALLFWAPVTGATPFPAPLAFPIRIFYLFVAMPPSAFLGFALYELRASPYRHYPALADVRAGGELMWLAGGVCMFCALMIVAFHWARYEERYAREAPER